VVQVAAMAADADSTPPVAGDDVDAVKWTNLEELRDMTGKLLLV